MLRAAFSGAERVHLIGLVSDGGVHSGWSHLEALIRLGASLEVPDLVLHAFTDGRDTLPHSGAGYLETVQGWMDDAGVGRIGSVVGRYWAMDRDKRWDRTQRAYDLLVHGRAPHRAPSGVEAVRQAYRARRDRRVHHPGAGGRLRGMHPARRLGVRVQLPPGPDAPDQLVPWRRLGFGEIDRGGAPAVERYATMTQYEEDFDYPVAFPPERPSVTLPRVLAERGVRQLHVAETEKYAHVTYFFSCGEEQPFEGERRELVPSPRDVPTYDFKPEMSAREAAAAFVGAWREDEPTFGIINFANSDMVGHTGVIEAAVRAVETVDGALGEVVAAVHESGGACVITADHGNSDHMLEDDGSPNTAHSLNPVPLIVTVPGLRLRGEGILADVAPTVLAILGIDQPAAMTGQSMIQDGG